MENGNVIENEKHGEVVEPTKLDVEAGVKKALTREEKMGRTYEYHKPSTEGIEKIQQIRAGFKALDALVRECAPPSRELSHAITVLEDAAMWSIKAVVINDPESVVEEVN